MPTEHKQFSVAPSIIYDLIERQAGSLSKAILEAVMNSVDAHADEIRIVFTSNDALLIEDNGVGFTTREDIEKLFGTFGFRHDSEAEKARGRTYGRFGLGRGQIMAFAATVWTTHQYAMHVDIPEKGLTYTIEDDVAPPFPGCRIAASLYRAVNRRERAAIAEDIRKQVRYAPIKVYVDGTLVTNARESTKWTLATDALLFHHQPHSESGVALYNLGIFTCTYPHQQFATSGTLVSRPGHPFTLNMARNDVVQSTCPVWREALALLAPFAREQRRENPLKDSDRHAIVRELLWGEAPDPGAHVRDPLLKTVHGRYISVRSATIHAKGAITVAPHTFSQKGETLHNEKLACVLSPEVLDWFDVESPADMVTRLDTLFGHVPDLGRHRISYLDFNAIAAGVSDDYALADQKRWTKTERAAIEALTRMSARLAADIGSATPSGKQIDRYRPRRIQLGASRLADAWTDATRYIVIERRFLHRQLTRSLNGWFTLCVTLIHEYMHENLSATDHAHSPEFFQAVHDLLGRETFDAYHVTTHAFQAYRKQRKKLGLKDTQALLRSIDHLESTTGIDLGNPGDPVPERPAQPEDEDAAPAPEGPPRTGRGPRRRNENNRPEAHPYTQGILAL